MTDRNVAGDATRSKHKAAQRKATELGLTPEDLELLADGVREFDAFRAADVRQAKALEKIAANTAPERDAEHSWKWEERRLRRREVYAQELAAFAMTCEDFQEPDMLAIRQSAAYRRLVDRLKGEPGASTPNSATT